MKKVSIIKDIESSLKKGKVFDAYNMALDALGRFPGNIRITQLYGLSLARLGATEKARKCMENLYNKDKRDAETAGILGRIYKDLWVKRGNIDFARKSRDIYLTNFKNSSDYYPGINAATMSLIIDEKDKAKKIAKQVISNIENKKSYWSLATLGEAFLLLENIEEAILYYRKARKKAGKNLGDINSSYHQINLISKFIEVPGEVFEILKPPTIIAFAGHMIDHPEKNEHRFPDYIAEPVKLEIIKILDELEGGIGYSSASCGSDILFIEAMLDRGAEVNVFLPFSKEDFLRTSVSFAGGEWENKFNSILERAEIKYITEESYLGNDDLFAFTNDIIMGISILRGTILLSEPNIVAVHDKSFTKLKQGGTGDMLNRWAHKNRVYTIDLSEIKKNMQLPETSVEQSARIKDSSVSIPFGIKRRLKFILFADIVGFSKLQEEYTPYLMYELLKAISDNIKTLKDQPEVLNTWGDAIFAVYGNATGLIEFALVINNIISNTNWTAKNIPIDINIRIALHAGPVFIGRDPITNRKNSYGSHINRAARMEPVTLPGCIYASEQFAAMLMVESSTCYRYEYVGIIELPKDFGKQEMYHITKNDEGTANLHLDIEKQ